jgi:ribosomal protein S18 acetylase RimI-like enzyme
MERPAVRSAGPADEAGVINVITLAFCADPLTRWAMPEAAVYLAAMPGSVRAFGGNGFAHGTVFFLDGCAGAAMWLPPGVEPDYERLAALMEEHVSPTILPDLSAVFEQMARHHPEEPHWYLPLIGVDPACCGRGLGSALMEHALQRCDAEGRPAYLESSNPRNIPLYERHGFHSLGTVQVGSSPPVMPMLRPPRRA